MLSTGVELAHDLRMPLQLIYSSAQMLRLCRDDPTLDAGAYLDVLMDSVGHMRRVLDAALEVGGGPEERDAPRLAAGDLVRCVRGLCQACRPYARQRGVKLACGGNVAALAMALDEDRLARILLNLLSNALRFTPPGGGIRVRWRALGDFVEISVEDDGPGIPPERLPRVFLEGESEGGHGYGLPIARRLARELDGELTARAGRGGRFVLRLPVRGTDGRSEE